MFSLTIKRIIKSGALNFLRNGVVSLSAVLVMIITLLILAGVIFSSALLNHTLISLKSKAAININFFESVSEQSVLKVKSDLESLPQVESVEYVSKEKVLENYIVRNRDKQTLLAPLEILGSNPFGASLNVKAKELSEYESINNFLIQNYSIDTTNSIIDTVNYSDKKLVIDRLTSIISAGEKFGAIVTILFIILSILITLNTIRLAIYISRDEIKVMNLVGADHGYITGPFVVAGAIYGLVSAIFVLIVLIPITHYIGQDTARLFFDLNVYQYYLQNFWQIMSIILVSGIFIGSISSFLAIKKYLQNK
ncbi:MAG TPA: permease-like cell division protein FtsX [Candidatus Paceibacterota bacterium]|nr:permease-like cell division protein FtsX [Candidatus Paceibacterota bacterium]HMP19243.1 permease-like cell division protein FtsX [Candidatus Paceibacterota bacterium]HMP85385.1 permease-like cell division protein FtsX [Candidatus Paceibacterota bacterium]